MCDFFAIVFHATCNVADDTIRMNAMNDIVLWFYFCLALRLFSTISSASEFGTGS